MSLHAQPTPETLATLQAQRRVTSVSSLLIAFLSMLLLALILGLWFLPPWLAGGPDVTVLRPRDPDRPKAKPKFVNHALQPKPASPAAPPNPVIVSRSMSSVSVPAPNITASVPRIEYGDGDDFGQGGGGRAGTGPDGDIPTRPIEMSRRCSKMDRLERLAETGGNAACEDAVVKGLDWLKATQRADGSWTGQNPAAMTGLALLAYLGHCETPASMNYGESCLHAIIYLVDLGLRNDGQLTTSPGAKHWPYEHAIATYALAEATTLCRTSNPPVDIPDLAKVTQRAGQFIIDNQNRSGGWDYAYQEDGTRGGDVSITAWQLQALKACKHTGLDFRNLDRCAKRAIDFVEARQNASGGIGYTSASGPAGNTGYFTLTGAGVLCLQQWNKGNSASARSGVRYLSNNTRFDYNSTFADLYGHYYEAQAMLNRGGESWRRYNELFRDQLLNNQNPDGSWKSPGNGTPLRAAGTAYVGGSPMAVHFRTTLNILMLEVYYRFLPGTAPSP